jgi:hypothetical protein
MPWLASAAAGKSETSQVLGRSQHPIFLKSAAAEALLSTSRRPLTGSWHACLREIARPQPAMGAPGAPAGRMPLQK